MKPLISGQKIKIDNHHSAQAATFKGLHIHKTVFGKFFSVEITIPFESDKNIEYSPLKNKKAEKTYNRVIKEINDVLNKDKSKREYFVNEMIKSVENFTNDSNKINNLRESAKSIAKHFDLLPEIEREISDIVKNKIQSYITIHKESNSEKMYYITQSYLNLEIGELMLNSTIYKLINKR